MSAKQDRGEAEGCQAYAGWATLQCSRAQGNMQSTVHGSTELHLPS